MSLCSSGYWHLSVVLSLLVMVVLTNPGLAAENGTKGDARAQPGETEIPAKDKKTETNSKDTRTSKDDKAPKDDKTEFTAEAITKLLEPTADPDLNYRVSAQVDGRKVLIQTWMNPKSNKNNKEDFEKDHKIDAVLITKNLIQAFPPETMSECKVRYFDRNDKTKYAEVKVVPGVVVAFGQGILKGDDLLAALNMTFGDTAPAPSASAPVISGGTAPISGRSLTEVAPGHKYEERGRLLKQIQKLEAMGGGMGAFRDALAGVEELVRNKDTTNVDAKLASLQVDVGKIEEAMTRAKAASTKPSAAKPGKAALTTAGTQITVTTVRGTQMKDPENDAHYAEMKKMFGAYYPHFGPMYPDRRRIAYQLQGYATRMVPELHRIPQLRKLMEAGKFDQISADDMSLVKAEPLLRNMPNLGAQFQQMEALVANGSPGVEAAVKRMNQSLGLSEMAKDERYRIVDTENKNWLAGGYK